MIDFGSSGMRPHLKPSTLAYAMLVALIATAARAEMPEAGAEAASVPVAAQVAGAGVPAAEAEPTALRAAASVSGRNIRLGDLFANAGARAADIVAAAPAPGASLTFEADWLALIARRHGLDWTPPNSFAEISVERAATRLDNAAIEAALVAKLAAGRADRRVKLDGEVRLYAPTGYGPGDIAVENVSLDDESGRFTADLRVADDEPGALPVRVTGRIDTVIQIPTLARPMMPGDVIGIEDIAWIPTRLDQLPAGDVTSAEMLIGRSPRHPLHARQVLRAVDIEQPVVVRRSELVLIVLERPGMYLTAEGQAQEDGGKGEVIHVTNLQSNRAVDAVVLGAGRVGVVAPGQEAMN